MIIDSNVKAADRRLSLSAAIFARCLLLAITLFISLPAPAHFQLNTNIRIIHIETLPDGVRLSIRFPAALAFSEFSGMAEGKAIPYLISQSNLDQFEHFLDQQKIEAELTAFNQFLVSGYGLDFDGKRLEAQAIKVKIFEASRQTRFTTLAEVSASFSEEKLFQSDQPLNISDMVIDVQAFYPTSDSNAEIRLKSLLKSNLPADIFVANLVIFYSEGDQQVMRITGLLDEPVIINPDALNAVKSFLIQGFEHILSGLDHILFILCLTVAATGLSRLLWAVTGFTLGHTLTLIAGFYGYVPTVSWFVPLIEVLIAASIIFIALVTLMKGTGSLNIVVTSLIGLLHGFGFSFLLGELLGPDSPNLMLSLISFNLGIELGQLFIVSIMSVSLLVLAHHRPSSRQIAGNTVLLGSMLVALWWVIERSLLLVPAI